jgi:hypothetical protein
VWFPWSPWSLIYYSGRTLESGRPGLIILATLAVVAVLAFKRPRHWLWWILGTVVTGAILATLAGDRQR